MKIVVGKKYRFFNSVHMSTANNGPGFISDDELDNTLNGLIVMVIKVDKFYYCQFINGPYNNRNFYFTKYNLKPLQRVDYIAYNAVNKPRGKRCN